MRCAIQGFARHCCHGLFAMLAVLLTVSTLHAAAPPGRLTIDVGKPGVKISPLFYGLMTEEINHSYDGGLYAELIQNRIFQDNRDNPVHWAALSTGQATGTIALDNTQPIPGTALTTCLRLEITGSNGQAGATNDGYWGIPVKPNLQYRASFYAKAGAGFTGPLTVAIESASGGTVYASALVATISTEWKRYTVMLKTGSVKPSVNNRFVISGRHSGTVWLNLVSLFPPTYKNRPNGNRIDLMQTMAGMNPAFLRMPGGNYLEGDTIATRFAWKTTLHGIAQRPGHQGTWGYRSSDGMGLLEFLEWCEDLHVEPVLAVFAGYALGHQYIAAGPELTPFVQEALDEIEYATGSKATKWGAVRVADGHPAPFKITYVEVGNEDWFDRSGSYDGRFGQFYDAIKAKYPKLKLIATTRVRLRQPDAYDDHYYRSAAAMANDAGHYDSYSRTGPKIFVGEWATKEGDPTPNFHAALGDAAWLTGLERNSDLVVMQCYAPLFVNVNPHGHQWSTNLIGYDALQSFGSPSYYVQAMFGQHRGDVVLPVRIAPQESAATSQPAPQGKIGVGTWATQAEFKDIEVTHDGQTLYRKDFTTGLTDWELARGRWQAADGVLRQTAETTDCQALAGDPTWGDYTYSLKARKLSGNEGFLVSFHAKDRDNRLMWNVGGWGDTRTALQRIQEGEATEISASSPVTVETGRWYDIRIEVQGSAIRCYLDGKLITEARDVPGGMSTPLFATASRVRANGDVFLKVVNISGDPQDMQIDLPGSRAVAGTAQGQVLTGDPQDSNTIAQPTKIAPKAITLTGVGRQFRHAFPAHSVTVLRLKVR